MNVNRAINIIKDLNSDPGSINEEYIRGQVELLAYLMGFQGDSSPTIEYIYGQLGVEPI